MKSDCQLVILPLWWGLAGFWWWQFFNQCSVSCEKNSKIISDAYTKLDINIFGTLNINYSILFDIKKQFWHSLILMLNRLFDFFTLFDRFSTLSFQKPTPDCDNLCFLQYNVCKVLPWTRPQEHSTLISSSSRIPATLGRSIGICTVIMHVMTLRNHYILLQHQNISAIESN